MKGRSLGLLWGNTLQGLEVDWLKFSNSLNQERTVYGQFFLCVCFVLQ